MDKKRIKAKKGEIQNNERRQEAEMFVLSPEILQKLGINLGQFSSPLSHPGTSHSSEASIANTESDKTAVSNSTVNNSIFTTKSKRKAAKTVITTEITNAEGKINKSDECNDPSELKKLLQSDNAFASYKRVSAEQTSDTQNSMSTSDASQANECSSSILETATLMKKSVLLSPTFCNTDINPNTCDQITELKESSAIPVTLICTKNVNKSLEALSNADSQPYGRSYGEIWTANVNVVNQVKEDNNATLMESTTAIDSAHWKTRYPETFAALSDSTQNTDNVNAIITNKMVEDFGLNTEYHESNNNNNFIRSAASSDCDDSQISVISAVGENLDEIYSSDASNQEIKNKIKIISEQILNPVQLQQIQNACASHKSNFMSVPVETLIRKTPESGEVIDNSSMHAESEFRETGSDLNELNDKDESNYMKVTGNLTETLDIKLSIPDGNENEVVIDLIRDSNQTIKSTTETRKIYSKKKKSTNESIPDINSTCVNRVDHKNTVNEDKVNEIASYLVQLMNDKRNKQHKKVESDERIYKCYKRHPNKAKLVSQGVEKPGGKLEIKSYSVNETKPLLEESLNCINMDSCISTDDVVCIGTTETRELSQTLCVCADFGRLDYYSGDNFYENIHFWYHKKDICEPELCFSIYSDGELSLYSEFDIQILNVPQVSMDETLINNSKSVKESKVIYEHASFSNPSTNSPATEKPGNHGSPKKNTTTNIKKLDDREILINNSKSTEVYEVPYEVLSSTPAMNTTVAEQSAKRGRGRPKKSSTTDNIKKLAENEILIDHSKPIGEPEVSYKKLSSTPSMHAAVVEQLAKRGRGRPRKNATTDNIETLDDSQFLINNSKSVEDGEASTPAINTPVAEQPAKRGRGRPVKNSVTNETISTIFDRKSSSKDQHNAENNSSQRLNSVSSSDEPLISKISEISSAIKTQNVKREQIDNAVPDSGLSCDVNGIANSSLSNHDLRCAICKQEVTNETWFEHIKIHNYLAWRDTEPAWDLDDEYEVIRHLTNISKEQGSLICSKCQKKYKTPKSYYGHVQSCDGGASKTDTSTASDLNTTQKSLPDIGAQHSRKRRKQTTVDEMVECGVCNETVKSAHWIEHIRVKHNYMAKRAGEIPLDEDNEEEVRDHLYNISIYNDGLICNKCGTKRKYVKSYFTHIDACSGPKIGEVINDPEVVKLDIDGNDIVKCAVCKLDVYGKLWFEHIQKMHKYLAWIEGEPPLDIDDPEQVHEHLQYVVKAVGFLRCWICSETRKIVKIFLQHVNLCESSGFGKLEPAEKNPNVGEDQFECGVCHEIGFIDQWKQHAMLKHYNVAWMVGQKPINIKNPYAVDKYLKEYKAKNSLVCKVCGETRVSCYGFYAHIMICGKSDAELEDLQILCEICNKKYVCVYKNQHMASHRDSEMRRERRERDAALMASLERESQRELEEEAFDPNRKRKAAERATKVIQDLKQEDDDDLSPKRSRSDSEDSVKMEETYEAESSDDDIEIDISDEVFELDEPRRERKKPDNASKQRRMPFKVEHFSTYVKSSYKDFCAYHFTNDCLFNDWRHKDIQLGSISEYLPSVTESCRIKYGDNNWTTYKRFEAAKMGRAIILFTGGCIQCLSWAPQPSNINEDFYFAVSTHRGPDVPRFDKDSTPVHPGLIQIWSLTDFGVLPEFSVGLVHDFGTIWAMDWCPSGARDVLPDTEENFTKYRLGLLAVACSNGFAYVLSVPYPDVNQSEATICKAIPVAELRVNMNSNKEIYQATSITWSPQKGHKIIVVGYADGTTALYDLSTKSPLLTKKENNTTIIYPFQDKRTGNGPISGVSVSPCMDRSRCVGPVCACGASGAGVWGARRGATQRTPLPATGVATTPHWPSYLLYAELAVSSKVVNELEWVGGGRRAGGACAGGVCGRCAHAVLSAPPALRLVRAHPCYPEPRKPLTLATLRMVPLTEKPLIKSDDLSMVIEPLTYEDTVSKYGLELKMTLKNKNTPKHFNELEQRAERFPLSDVSAISFCPSDRYHNRVAIASHSGLVFILNVPD